MRVHLGSHGKPIHIVNYVKIRTSLITALRTAQRVNYPQKLAFAFKHEACKTATDVQVSTRKFCKLLFFSQYFFFSYPCFHFLEFFSDYKNYFEIIIAKCSHVKEIANNDCDEPASLVIILIPNPIVHSYSTQTV